MTEFRGEVTKTVYAPGGVCAVQRSVCVLRVCTKEEVESESTARVQECNALWAYRSRARMNADAMQYVILNKHSG